MMHQNLILAPPMSRIFCNQLRTSVFILPKPMDEDWTSLMSIDHPMGSLATHYDAIFSIHCFPLKVFD